MIILYGAGQEFIKCVKENKIKKFDYVIDTYPQNYPQGVCGYTIYDNTKISDLTEHDFVCITSKKYYDDIFQTIREMNNVVTIINLYQLEWMENTFPGLLAVLRNRDEVYESVDENQVSQWMKGTEDDEIEYWKRRIPEVRKGGIKGL